MSLSKKEMYNITSAIWVNFNSKEDYNLLYVNHTPEKIKSMEHYIPYNKYNTSTKQNYIIYNLYINFNQSPSSVTKAFKLLKTLNTKEAIKFKNEIQNIKVYIKQDLEKLYNVNNLNVKILLQMYLRKEIKWFTLLLHYNIFKEEFQELENSRIFKRIILKMNKMSCYITFSNETKEYYKNNIINQKNTIKL